MTVFSVGLFILLSVPAARGVERPAIRIVYPREGQQMLPVDSQFVVGQALGATKLWVNGVPTELFDSGAFLGWIPVFPGTFPIEVVARNEAGESRLMCTVDVLRPAAETPQDSLRVETDFSEPAKDLWLWPGDLLEVTCRTTPRAEVFFTLPGVVEDVRMTELPPQRQSLFAGSAFRKSRAPDSLRLHGVYYGAYRIGAGERADSAKVRIRARNRVALYTRSDRDHLYASDSVRYSIDSSFADLFTTDSSAGRVTIMDDRFPYLAQITDSAIVTRFGPGLGYIWPFQAEGTRMEVTGRRGPWIRMRPAPHQEIWAHDTSLSLLALGLPAPSGTVNRTRIDGFADRTDVRLYFSERLPYRVTEDLDPLALTVTVYGATSDIDWIRYDYDDALVAWADWRQPEPGVFEYTVHLNAVQLWGYDSYWDGSELVLSIRKPPDGGFDLRSFHVVLDPGHSADDGAIGPTGLREKEANLLIAQRLGEALERRGAQVSLTRSGAEDLPLYERPKIAKAAGADLFISIHNNALPDGVNPWAGHGVSTYYYHPFAKGLAECVQGALLEELGMPDFGLYRANFAVIRPTQYPAILVECAFMIIPEHEAALKTTAFQDDVAGAIVDGIEVFIKRTLPDEKYEAALKQKRRSSRKTPAFRRGR